MTNILLTALAQIPEKNLDPVAPRLGEEGSTLIPWLIVAAAVVGILAVAFKISKRTHMES